MILKQNNLILIISLFFLYQGILAQNTEETKTNEKPIASLIQSSGYGNSEIESLNIDHLRNEMRKIPNSKGLFVIYCGKTCQYGEAEAHIRGLKVSLIGKGWKSSEFIILQGGYKENLTIEYWLVPENACFPIPNSEIDI